MAKVFGFKPAASTLKALDATLHEYERVHCFPCGGSGRVKGRRAKAGSSAAVGRRKLAICQGCFGYGYTEQRIRPRVDQ